MWLVIAVVADSPTGGGVSILFRSMLIIVRATGHKTPGESSEIRIRLLKGYSTLYTRFTFLVSGSV